MMKFVAVAILAAFLIPVPSESAINFVPDTVIDEPVIDEVVVQEAASDPVCACCKCNAVSNNRKPVRNSVRRILRLLWSKK